MAMISNYFRRAGVLDEEAREYCIIGNARILAYVTTVEKARPDGQVVPDVESKS